MKIKFISILMLLCAVAFANTFSCAPATFNGTTGLFDYYDNYNNSLTGDVVFYPPHGVIDNAAQIKIWGQSVSILEVIKWQNVTDRGMAVLAKASTGTTPYRAFFQYNDELYAVTNLAIQAHNGSAYYYNSHEAVFFENVGTVNSTAIKLLNTNSNPSGSEWFEGYRYGNSSFYYSLFREISAPNWHHFSETGNGSKFRQYGTISLHGISTQNAWYSAFWDISAGGLPPACSDAYCWGDFPVFDVNDLAIDYYSCADSSGDIMFFSYEGTDECAGVANVPPFDCSIFGYGLTDDCTLSAGTNSTISATLTTPSLQEFTPRTSDGTYLYDRLLGKNTHSCEYVENAQGEGFTIYMTESSEEAIHIKPEHIDADLAKLELGAWLQEVLVGNVKYEDGERLITGTFKYNPPVDLKTMDINATEFIDFPISVDACNSGTTWLFLGIVGYNSTHYYAYNQECNNGVEGISNSFYPTNTTFITANVSNAAYMLKNDCVDAIDNPVEFNVPDGTIDRYFLYWFDLTSFTPSDNYGVVQDTVFAMNYNYTLLMEQNCTISDYPFGNYSYLCVPPSGYAGGISGEIVHDKPISVINIPLQETRELYIAITVTDKGSARAGLKCIGNYGIATTNASGTCVLQTNADVTDTIRITQIPNHEDILFNATISDYYNSDRLGDDGEQNNCFTFDGIYKFYYDIANPYMSFWLQGVTTRGNLIAGVQFYVDGESVGSSDSSGQYYHQITFDAVSHQLVSEKSGWTNGSAAFDYRDRDDNVQALMHPDTETAARTAMMETGDYTNVHEYLLSPLALGLGLTIVAIIGTAIMTGLVPIAALVGCICLAALVLFGAIPIWIGIVLIIIAAAFGFVIFGGLFG